MKTRGRLKLKFRAKLKKSLWTREDMLGRVGKWCFLFSFDKIEKPVNIFR